MEAILSASKEEQVLVQKAQAGDQMGVAGLYQLHADRLYRQVIYPCIPNAQAAEDVLKDTFLTVIRRIKNYRWDENKGIFPWLARIAKNRALDLHRKQTRETRFQGNYRAELDRLSPNQSAEQILEEGQEAALLKKYVKECLEQLNPRYQKVLELRMFQELSREESAKILDVQVGTLDVVLHRALKAFRKRWDEQDRSHGK